MRGFLAFATSATLGCREQRQEIDGREPMDHIAAATIKYRKSIVAIFVVAVLVCAPLALLVKVNYNMADYLPPFVQSTDGIGIHARQFSDALPNASVMIRDVSLPEALSYRSQLEAVEGVEAVLWLDDVVNIKTPLEMADKDTVEGFYKDGNARYNLVMYESAVPLVEELIGPDNALAGEAPALVAVQGATSGEVLNAFMILIPAVILILVLTTTSWLEPLLLLLGIAVSIILNMGTNIFFGEISFITNSVSPILQLAVSLDYAIILLHAFAEQRQTGLGVEAAMKNAIKVAFATISASASTTLFGFLALVFMDFLIGADLGINLAKGIIFSFICVIILLPAVTLSVYKLMDRLKHRPFIPSTMGVHKVLMKLAIPVTVLVLLALVPSYLGQMRTNFLYGSESAGSGTRAAQDLLAINAEFGESNIVAVLVPRGDVAKETQLSDDLEELPHVTSVMSYAHSVSAEIPPEFLDQSVTRQFYSADYARLLVYVDTATEGDVAFSTVEAIESAVAEYYPSDTYLIGRSPILFDIKNVVQNDNLKVNLIAIVAIFLVLLMTFRSLVLPFILLLTIELAIWLNLSIPYFSGTSINYIGYLVLSTIQLGATVDYAILLTSTYLRYRKTMPKRQAIHNALGYSFKPILMSAGILSIAGFALYAASSNAIVCDIGLLLGRGTLFSSALVLTFLPALLFIFDPLIGWLSLRSRFYKPGAAPPAAPVPLSVAAAPPPVPLSVATAPPPLPLSAAAPPPPPPTVATAPPPAAPQPPILPQP
jgi:predicted RND superfamily exporter protein